MRTKKFDKGLTLIELMSVIAILGILLAITIPNFINSSERAKIAQLKANMHIVQSIEELYGIDYNGTYTTLDKLSQYNGWKDFTNPFNLKEGVNLSFYDKNLESVLNLKDDKGIGGLVGLELIKWTKYYIYASDKEGNDYIKDNNRYYILSNS